MADLARKALFACIVSPALVRAVLRLAWLDRRHDLEELAERMTRVRPWRLAWLDNPRYLAACAQRVAGLIPGRGFGPCLERSLLLLDLWSRCGLHPRIHLGALSAGEAEHRFHAWVSLPLDETRLTSVTARHAEIWAYPRGR